MARIAGEESFSGIPSARSGRAIAREDVSPLFAGADALGQGIRQAGGALVSVAGDLAAKREQLQQFNAEAQFQRFNNQETEGLINAQREVPAGGADGFANTWEFGPDGESGFNARARSFMEGIPANLRPSFDARLVSLAGDLRANATDFGIGEQVRVTAQQLDDTLNNTILPRIAVAITSDDPQAALAEIIADGEALINANPYLTPVQRDQLINGDGQNAGWRTRAQLAFNNALPADQRAAYLGVPPTEAQATAYLAERAPGLTVQGMDADFGTRLAQAAMDYERLTGQEANFASFVRTPERQAQLYANYLLSSGQGESYTYNGVTYYGDPSEPVGLAAPPGQSRHQSGTAADIPEGAFLDWMHENAAQYGLEFLSGGAFTDDPGHVQLGSTGALPAARLDAIPYEQRNALAADAQTQMARDAAAQTAAQNAENAARLNQLLVGIHDGSLGAAAVLQARNEGWLTDYADIQRVDTAMETAYGDIIDTQAALGLVNDPNYTFNPFNTEDRDAVDTAFEAMGGVGALLSTDADEEEQQQAVGRTMAMVRRTGIVPEAAMDALLGGMYSNDPATMAAAFTILDAIYRDNPRALTGPEGFTPEQQLRYDTYQTLAPLMTPEALMERMRPDLDPREAARQDQMREQGRALAEQRTDEEIVNNFIQGFWGAGEAAFPEGTQMLALRDDYNTLFAERYAVTGNAEAAHTQALEALRQKWGVSDAGDTRRVMSYPPEQQFQPVPNSGADGYQYMRDAIRSLVEQVVGPNAQAYWLVATDATEAALGTGDPPYQVVAIDQNGQLAVFTAGGLAADREAAMTAARDQFEADRLVAQPQVDAMQTYQAELNRIAVERNGGAIDAAEAGRQAQAALAALNAALEGSGAPPVTHEEAAAELSPGTLRPPSIRPLGMGQSGVLMQFEPARTDMPPPPPTAAERGAQAEPPPVPVQNDVPEGFVRLLGGAVVPRADAAKQVVDRIKTELAAPTPREPKDEEAGMMQRAIAARKRMLAEQAANPSTAPRVPQTPPQVAGPRPTAASSPAATVWSAPTPPDIRRAPASNGMRRANAEVPMDYATMPVMNPLPRIAGNIQPGNVAGYARPTTAPTVAVDRRPLPPVQVPPPPREFVPPVMATPAIRDRDIGSMTLAELDWFLDYGDPSPEELRRMSIRANLLREQAEVNVIVTGATR